MLFFLFFIVYSGLFVWFFSMIYQISNLKISLNVKKYETYSKRAAQRMYNFIKKKENAKIKRLTDSELAFYNKKNQWVLDTENVVQAIQRKIHENRRDKYHLPIQTYGLNVEILGLQLVWLFVYVVSCIIFNEFIEKKYFLLIGIVLIISILLISRSFGILFPFKIAWWTPWRLFFHVYSGGNKSIKFNVFLLFFYFKANVVFWVLCILFYGVFNWISHSYAYFRFRAWMKKILIVYGGTLVERSAQICFKILKQLQKTKKKLTPFMRRIIKKAKQAIITFDTQVFKLDIKIDKKVIKYKKKLYKLKSKLKSFIFGKRR